MAYHWTRTPDLSRLLHERLGSNPNLEREKAMTEDFKVVNEALTARIEELIEDVKTLRIQRDIARLERDILRNKVQEETA